MIRGRRTSASHPSPLKPGDQEPKSAQRGGTLSERARAHVRNPLFGNAYALIANTGLTAVLGLAYWVAAARLYDPAAVGTAAAAVSALALLSGLAQLNLEAVMVRFVPVSGARTRLLAGIVHAICIATAVAVSSAFMAGLDLWSPALGFLRQNAIWAAWFVVSTVTWVIFVLQDGLLVGLGRALWVPIENSAFGAAKLLLLIALPASGGAATIFASWTIPALVVVLPMSALIFLRLIPEHARSSTARANPSLFRDARRYAVGDYAGSMFELASVTLLPLIVTHWAGAEENAFFYQSWTIAYALRLVADNTTRSLTVEAARDQSRLERDGRVVFLHTTRLLALGIAVIVLAAPLLLSLFGPAYTDAATSLRLLALAAIPTTVVLLALTAARVRRRVGEVVVIQGVAAALALGASVALVQPYGATGVAAAWLGSQSVVALLLLLTRLRWLYQPAPNPADRS